MSALGELGIYIPYESWHLIPEVSYDNRIGYHELLGWVKSRQKRIPSVDGKEQSEVYESDISQKEWRKGDVIRR